MTRIKTLVCLASILVANNFSYALIVGSSWEIMDFSNGYILADGSIHAPSANAVRCAWYADEGRHTVWRLWVHTDSPTDAVWAIASTQGFPFLISTNGVNGFFNHPFGSITSPNANIMPFFGDLAFDSFLTLGNATGGGPGTDVIQLQGDLQGYALDTNINSGEAGWTVQGPPVPGLGLIPAGNGGWKILIAQITIEAGAQLNFMGVAFSSNNNVPITPCPIEGCGYDAWDCNQNGVTDLDEIGLGISPDLNVNHIPDDCDIASGSSSDCNGNLVPDEIDLFRDCAPVQPDGSFGDGAVDMQDLVAVLTNFGAPGGPCDVAPHPCGNGVVNIDDLVIVLNSFGPCP